MSAPFDLWGHKNHRSRLTTLRAMRGVVFLRQVARCVHLENIHLFLSNKSDDISTWNIFE